MRIEFPTDKLFGSNLKIAKPTLKHWEGYKKAGLTLKSRIADAMMKFKTR